MAASTPDQTACCEAGVDMPSATVAITAEQVQESIAKARADAQAKGKDVPPAAPAEEEEAPAPAAMPATQAAVPIPDVAAAPPPSGGGGWGKLFVGLILGLVIGAGGMFGHGQLTAQTKAAQALEQAEAARALVEGQDNALTSRAGQAFSDGNAAYTAGSYGEAYDHFVAAEALYGAAGGSQ